MEVHLESPSTTPGIIETHLSKTITENVEALRLRRASFNKGRFEIVECESEESEDIETPQSDISTDLILEVNCTVYSSWHPQSNTSNNSHLLAKQRVNLQQTQRSRLQQSQPRFCARMDNQPSDGEGRKRDRSQIDRDGTTNQTNSHPSQPDTQMEGLTLSPPRKRHEGNLDLDLPEHKRPTLSDDEDEIQWEPSPRELVRIFQCEVCDRLIHNPTTLLCGNTLCRECLPEPHNRENVSYPPGHIREKGIRCPFDDCRRDHALVDCSRKDYALNKVLDQVRKTIDSVAFISGLSAEDVPEVLAEEKASSETDTVMSPGRQHTAQGGKMITTYKMAEEGKLAYTSDLRYRRVSGKQRNVNAMDSSTLSELKQSTRTELDCQICYGLLLSPITMWCGHTFCRSCIQRVFDHGPNCPVCREPLNITADVSPSRYPDNKRLASLLSLLHPEALAQRAEQHAAHIANLDTLQGDGFTTPLFVCALSYPGTPTFLHIFEPRYRLMIRRAMMGNRQFGLVIRTPFRYGVGIEPPSRGSPVLYPYGTMVRIVDYQPLPDGRSLIETRGVARFEIEAMREQDGYLVGRTRRFDDFPADEEDRIEEFETSLDPSLETPLPAPQYSIPHARWAEIARMPTADLFTMVRDFVMRHRSNGASWITEQTIQAHGVPPEDAAQFTWWFAAVLPMGDVEKCRLLQEQCVRRRLRIQAGWVDILDRAEQEVMRRGESQGSCSMM